jgi:flagellar hook-basal body complex protein FliE
MANGVEMLAAMDALTGVGRSISTIGGQIDGMSGASKTGSAPVTGESPFAGLFGAALGQVATLESQAHAAVEGLITGSGVDVHQAMIASEKASMAFELAIAVRNKAVQAYQSVMGLQF